MARPIEVKVTGDVSSATRGLGDVNRELGTLQGAGKGDWGGIKRLGAALLAGGALAKAGGYLKEAAFAASDMNETVSKTKQVFGRDAGGILKWSKESNAALLGTERAVLDAAGGFALLLGNKGINGAQGRKWSKNLTDLSADLASFFNTDFESAAAAVSSALKGEMDPIERYGVSINDATLKAKAFELGLYSGKGALDSSTKAQAAYALVMEQTAKAQGDVERTQGGFANQWRTLNTELDELETNVGQALTPIGEAILPTINTVLGDVNAKLGEKGAGGLFTSIGATLKEKIVPAAEDFSGWLGDVDVQDIKADFGWLKLAADDIAAGAKAVWRAWDNLSPNTKANIATLVAAGAALKALTMANPVIKIGVNLAGEVLTSAAGAAASATVGALFNRAIPMNVFVTNPGFANLDIESPGGKGKLGRVLHTIPVIATLLAVVDTVNTKTEANAKGLREIAPEVAALRGATSAVAPDFARLKRQMSTVNDLLELETQYRKSGDAAVRDQLDAMIRALQQRQTGVRLPGSNKWVPLSAAGTGTPLPTVSDEQIARAVYGTLMRSGIRNGQLQVAVP